MERDEKRRWWEEGEEEKLEEDWWRHFGGEGDWAERRRRPHFKRHAGYGSSLNKWTTMIRSWESHYQTGKHLTAQCRSLNAQETYYGHGNGAQQSYESCTALYALGSSGASEPQSRAAWKHLQRRLGKMNSGAARALREPRHWSGRQWLNVQGPMRATGVKSACHRQLTGVLRRPAGTPCSEVRRSALDGEQSRESETAAPQRGGRGGADRQTRPFMWWFHFSILEITSLTFVRVFFFIHLRLSARLSLVICRLPTRTSALCDRSRSGNRETQKCALLQMYSRKFGGVQVHFLFLRRDRLNKFMWVSRLITIHLSD